MTEPPVLNRTVTIQDVARAAGVAKATASYALSGKGQLSPATRELVLQTARSLGFEPNLNAQRLSQGRSHDTIGLFALRLDLGVAAQKVQLIQRRLSKEGFRIPVYTGGFDNDDEPARDAEAAELLGELRRQRPAAIVCHTMLLGEQSLGELERYQSEGGVVVIYDNPVRLQCDRVVFDRHDNTYRAARHLVELGHRDIGLYMPGSVLEPEPDDQHPRLQGFIQALGEAGLALQPEWLFGGGQYEEGGALLAQRFLQLKRRPTAICIVNDDAATAFIAETGRAGLRVPEDIAVVSHDDLPTARYASVPLTSMSHPVAAIADGVVDLVLSRLRTPDAPTQVRTVCGELQVRSSSGVSLDRS